MALYGAETWTLRTADQTYLEISGTWCWRMEVIWTDRVRNEEMLHRVKDERNIVTSIEGGLTGLVTSRAGTAL
jgi:hypothetical protein